MVTTPQQRDTLFISHALPEDNEFAKWLSSRLKNEGYKVWCEIDEVHGGEHFWKEIEPVIRFKSVKFIYVASHISVEKSGVRDEWDFAKNVARENNLKDFIIPINLDGVSNNAIIGLAGLGMLQFQNSWANGLKALIRKLTKDAVPKQIENGPLSVTEWLKNQYSDTHRGFYPKKEHFYSNWLDLPPLSKDIYLHEYSNKEQADCAIDQLRTQKYYPVVQHEKYLISFSKKLPEILTGNVNGLILSSASYKAKKIIHLTTKSILEKKQHRNEFPTYQDASNLLVQLLRQCIHEFLLTTGLKTYALSNKKLCYYYERMKEGESDDEEMSDIKVKFDYNGTHKSRQLTGKFFDDVWHYAVSFNPRLRPFPSISLNAHILFSVNGFQMWTDKKKIHSARRKKGKRMFNAAWRDLLLAFLSSLPHENGTFAIPVAENEYIWLSTTPLQFTSDFGYLDPSGNERLVPIDDFKDEQEYEDMEFYSHQSDDEDIEEGQEIVD